MGREDRGQGPFPEGQRGPSEGTQTPAVWALLLCPALARQMVFSSRIVSLCFSAGLWLGSSSAAYHAGHPEPRFRNSGPFSLSVLCRQRSGEPSAGAWRALGWDGCPQLSGGDRGSSEATSQGNAAAAKGPAPSHHQISR